MTHPTQDDKLLERLEKEAEKSVRCNRIATDAMFGKDYESVSLENTLEYKAAARIRSLSAEVGKRKGAAKQLVEELGRCSERLEHRSNELADSESQLSDALELLEDINDCLRTLKGDYQTFRGTSRHKLNMDHTVVDMRRAIESHLSRTKPEGRTKEELAEQAAHDRAEAIDPAQWDELCVELNEKQDKIDGLEADLHEALDVLWRRGDSEAREWIRLNYPAFPDSTKPQPSKESMHKSIIRSAEKLAHEIHNDVMAEEAEIAAAIQLAIDDAYRRGQAAQPAKEKVDG